ncbi:O-antigen ligase family protein [Vibrio cholerae]|uniref:O-antigen ligase family protein n=1 Tax=Vibrio cholerae TaxID=666 RepID=UPI0000EF8DCE|nr:O-antigen ligase [Vibrio cholerae]EGR0260341.1 O-antigen ligase family protein [Vibrio cholerae]EGR0494306.1 O-antigen ligase family protein [Vibrio cholerae]EGR0557313.1 O-antigen ligase family protein [Vibrio cholerae]EGR1035816.1 O-antigen ligase family protein [Vibrio cholerae]EGR2014228.1 O-antigen ligase family protein [Vibrio cholerae]
MNNKITKISIFFTVSLLLITPGFSVVTVGFLTLYSSVKLIKNGFNFNKSDFIPIIILSAYFLSNVPITVIDGGTLRYLDAGIRSLLCIPIYFFIKSEIAKGTNLDSTLYTSTILASFGALAFAVYQFFILNMPRVDGFLFSINFGYLAAALAIISFGLSFTQTQFKHYLYLSAIAATVATTLTLTRGAILTLPLVFMLFFIVNVRKLKFKQTLFFTLVGFLLLSASYQISPRIQERVDFTIFEISGIASNNVHAAASSGGRLQLWYAALEAFKRNPILGTTYSERESLNIELFKEGKVDEWTSTVPRGHAHSQYFEAIASNGTFGILAIFAMLVLPFGLFLNDYRKTGSPISQTGYLFVFGFIIFCLTEAPLQANLIGTFYGFMVAIFYAYIAAKRAKN